jgi:hypothetical protein
VKVDALPQQVEEELKESELLQIDQIQISSDEVSCDLQDILMERLQKCLPEVLEMASTKKDFFMLPYECINTLFSSNQTLVSEFKLFRVIEEQLRRGRASGNRKPSDQSEPSSSE